MIRFKWSGRIVVAVGLPVILAACVPAASPGNPAASPGVPSGWTAATLVPGLAGLGTADMNVVTTVSCTVPGDCTAGGDYLPPQNAAHEIYRPFVVTESGGTWGTAQEVPGVGQQPAADPATLTQISCSSPGNCAAVGYYWGVAGDDTGKGAASAESFTVTQTNGRWGDIRLVPRVAAPEGNNILLFSVSCAPVPAQAPRHRGRKRQQEGSGSA